MHVTHRGETVAESRPPTHLSDNHIDNELRLRTHAGKVRFGARNRPEAHISISTSVQLPEGTAQTLLNDSGGEC